MKKKQLLVSITGRHKKDWVNKLAEIEKYKISEIALYLEIFNPTDRIGLFDSLKKSCIKKIPMAHIRTDITKKELEIMYKTFGTRYFTIHENHFDKKIINQWKGYYKNLYLEMNTDDYVSPKVKVENIGGFCIDLAHFKKQVTLQDREYAYVVEHINKSKSGCNHLSGYSYKRNKDLHTVKSSKDFQYIKTLPHNLFGNIISFEVFNSIQDQLKYIPVVKKILEKNLKFSIKT